MFSERANSSPSADFHLGSFVPEAIMASGFFSKNAPIFIFEDWGMNTFIMILYTEENPNEDIGRNDGSHGEGNADFEEVTIGNLMTILTQDTDAGNICRSAEFSVKIQ